MMVFSRSVVGICQYVPHFSRSLASKQAKLLCK